MNNCIECGQEAVFSVSMKRRKPPGQRTCQDCVQKKATGSVSSEGKAKSDRDSETLAMLDALVRSEGVRAPIGSKTAKKKTPKPAESGEGDTQGDENVDKSSSSQSNKTSLRKQEMSLKSNWGETKGNGSKNSSQSVVMHTSNPLLANETKTSTHRKQPNRSSSAYTAAREQAETIDFLASEFLSEAAEDSVTSSSTATNATTAATPQSSASSAPKLAPVHTPKVPKYVAPAFPKCFMCGQRHDLGQCGSKQKLRDAELNAIEE